MDPSAPGLPHPVAGPPNGERRHSVRQKLHSPVYVSFNGPETGMVVDLSELLDLHEEGFAVQTSEPLEMNRAVTLCLDLPETKSYIHGSGQVIWSDATGRGGIRFSAISEKSRHVLQEWLFTNLLIGCSNHAARTQQLARREKETLPEPVLASASSSDVPISDGSEMLSRVETRLAPPQTRPTASLQVEPIRREVLEIGDDFDAVLQLITKQALTLTGAGGAALAFLTDDRMTCRARAGESAPPLGAPVDVKQGLSGECVSSGLLISCEDTDNDPRIDPEIGRALGIGSLMAVPIAPDLQVVGLLEVFSPHPRRFTASHGMLLEELVELIPHFRRSQPEPRNTQLDDTQPETPSRPEAGSRPPALESTSTEPASAESGLTEPASPEFDSIPALREALREREPETPEQLSPRVPEEIVSEQFQEQVAGQDPEPQRTVPSHLHYRALLGLTIAAVAIAIGYSLGPSIEKRWAGSPQASQRSSVQGGEADSLQRAADPGLTNQSLTNQRLANQRSANRSAEQRTQAMSLPELRKLADQGDADAQYQLGMRYHNGEDVPHDDAQAVQWYLRAADQGNVSAQSSLGAYYWAGRGVPEDLTKAYFWSEIALAGGDENSKSRLEGLASQMTRQQVSTATQQAEEWLHAHSQRTRSQAN